MPGQELADRIVPILGFLLCITVVAELADRIGVFAYVADKAAWLARGSTWRLWILVVLVATVSAAVLSLDTTAVLLTPVVLALASQLGVHRALFAYTTVWLANTASLFLPVSNLTNLLALDLMPGIAGFTRLMWPAAVAAVVVTVLVLALIFRKSLRGSYRQVPIHPSPDRLLLVIAMIVCALLGPAFAAGVDVTLGSAVAALILTVSCLFRAPQMLSWRLVPWLLILGVAVLFVLVQVLHDHGLTPLLDAAAGHGERFLDLLQLTAVAAVGANGINNLPAYLAMEPLAAGSPLRIAALLVGVNCGPLITPWASVATLLWAGRCAAAGVTVNWRTFALRGLIIVPLVLLAGTGALSLIHG